MQVASTSSLRILSLCAIVALTAPLARAASNSSAPGELIDTTLIATLTTRAQQAQPRDQVQAYADLADKISLLANKQIVDGDIEAAQKTLQQLEACTLVIETGLQRDSRGLKKTEMLLHATHRRLTDMIRAASGDMKPIVQTTLKRLEKAQTILLAAVFEH